MIEEREREKKGDYFGKSLRCQKRIEFRTRVKEVAFDRNGYKSFVHTVGRPRIWGEIQVDLWCGGEKMMLFLMAHISSKKFARYS